MLNVDEGERTCIPFPPALLVPGGAFGTRRNNCSTAVHLKNVRTGKECGCFPFG